MGHARHKTLEADERLESANIENTNVLDERKVLELLETALYNDDRNRIVGIGNGLAIGAALWALFITAVIVAL